MLSVDLVSDKKIVEISQTQVFYLISIDEILRKRLKYQATKEHKSRGRIIMVCLYKIRPVPFKLKLDGQFLLVSQDFKLHRVPFEFPFDNFRHIDALPVKLDEAVAGNRMIVNREKNITLAQF